MCLLEQVEQRLGQIDTWPTYIIRYLFIDVTKHRIVRKLTASFYGNDIPESIASRFYNACNDIYNLHATEYNCNLYSHWQRCMYMMSGSNNSSLFDTLKQLSQGPALAGNVSSFKSKQLYQYVRRHYYIVGYCTIMSSDISKNITITQHYDALGLSVKLDRAARSSGLTCTLQSPNTMTHAPAIPTNMFELLPFSQLYRVLNYSVQRSGVTIRGQE